jgi:Flp pilus assembly protein TadD
MMKRLMLITLMPTVWCSGIAANETLEATASAQLIQIEQQPQQVTVLPVKAADVSAAANDSSPAPSSSQLTPVSGPVSEPGSTSQANTASGSCPGMQQGWSTARNFQQRVMPEAALQTFERLLDDCPDANDRLATLYQARDVLGREAVLPLAQQQLQRLQAEKPRRELQTWLHQQRNDKALALFRAGHYGAASRWLLSYQDDIQQRRDIGMARLLADSLTRQQQYDAALRWRQQAALWSGGETEDMQAQIWLHINQGNLAAASQLSRHANGRQRYLIASQHASRAFKEERYQDTLGHLDDAKRWQRREGADHSSMRAWSLYHLQQFAPAYALFSQLYQRQPSDDLAKGLFYSASHSQQLQAALQQHNQHGLINTLVTDPLVLDLSGERDLNDEHHPLAIPEYDPQTQAMVAQLRQQLAGEQAAQLLNSDDPEHIHRLSLNLQRYTEHQQDAGLARALAAAHGQAADQMQGEPRQRQLQQSIDWRQRAIAWSESNGEDRLALATAFIQLQRTEEAEQLLQQLVHEQPDSPAQRDLLSALLSQRASQAYDDEDYEGSLQQLDKLEHYQSLNAEQWQLRGWSLYRLQDYGYAFDAFQTAYQLDDSNPDSAAALMFSAYADNNLDAAAELATQHPGSLRPLLGYQRTFDAARDGVDADYFDLDTNGRIVLQPWSGSRWVSTQGMRLEQRSGERGTSQLTALRMPVVQLHWQPHYSRHQWFGQLSLLQLNSGDSTDTSPLGTPECLLAPTEDPCPRRTTDSGSQGLLLEPGLNYRYQGSWLGLDLGLGTTPMGAEVDARWTGNAGFNIGDEAAGISVAGQRSAKRDSMLSYVGVEDPYSSDAWGRVLQDQLNISAYAQLAEHSDVLASLDVAEYQGEDVRRNQSINFYSRLSFLAAMPRGELAFGPELLTSRYQRNLSGFSRGHGGYFSPQMLVRMGGFAHWQQPLSRRTYWRSQWSLGYQVHHQDCLKAWFNNSSQCYQDSSDEAGVAASADLALLHRLGRSQHHIGSQLQLSISPEFEQWSVWVFWQYASDGDTLQQLLTKALRSP